MAEARDAMTAAWALARQLAHASLGTEHLLFSIATGPASRGRRVLEALEVDFADIKRELDAVLRRAPGRRAFRRACRGPC